MQNRKSQDIIPEEGQDKIEEENGSSEDNENLEEALESSELYQLETQFQASPNIEIASKLIQIYQDLEDPKNVRRIRETLLENATLTEGNPLISNHLTSQNNG